MSDFEDDIPQPFSVRLRLREWEVVVLPLLLRAKPTMVAVSANKSIAETIAEECNAAAIAYAKALIARKKRWQTTPKPKAVRAAKELRAVRGADAKESKTVEVKAKEPGDRENLLRQILALPAIKKAIKGGELSLQTLKKDSLSRLLRRQERLLGNSGPHNGGGRAASREFCSCGNSK